MRKNRLFKGIIAVSNGGYSIQIPISTLFELCPKIKGLPIKWEGKQIGKVISAYVNPNGLVIEMEVEE